MIKSFCPICQCVTENIIYIEKDIKFEFEDGAWREGKQQILICDKCGESCTRIVCIDYEISEEEKIIIEQSKLVTYYYDEITPKVFLNVPFKTRILYKAIVYAFNLEKYNKCSLGIEEIIEKICTELLSMKETKKKSINQLSKNSKIKNYLAFLVSDKLISFKEAELIENQIELKNKAFGFRKKTELINLLEGYNNN